MSQDINPNISNRTRLFLTTIALAVIIPLAGCGSSDSGTTDEANATEQPTNNSNNTNTNNTNNSEPQSPDLTGNWVSPCFPQGDGSFAKLDFDLTQERWALDYIVYGDDTCATKNLTVFIEGPYELTAPSDAVDGAWEGRFAFDSKTVTPHAEGAAGFLNSDNGCGDGWEAGVTRDISDTGCAPLGQQPISACQQDYDIVKLDGGQLQFGSRPADNNMCTEDRRPTEASPLTLERV